MLDFVFHKKINAKIPLIFQTPKFFVENISFNTTFFADTTLFLPKIASTLDVHVGQKAHDTNWVPSKRKKNLAEDYSDTHSAQKELYQER